MFKSMLTQHDQICSSNMNCQQFARLFIVEALGLDWPMDLQVEGDVLPISIDIGSFFISKKTARKFRKLIHFFD